MSGPDSGYQFWFAKADNDILNIENNIAAESVPWDTVCFHAQQAAEKTLKGFPLYNGRTPKRTHDLVVLLTECVEVAPDLRKLEGVCQKLTYFSVGVRYPDDLYEPTEQDARQLVADVRLLRSTIFDLIPG